MAFPNESISKFQQMIWDIYGVPDDRLYSNWDLLSNLERFTMWSLKGIRKGKTGEIKINIDQTNLPENINESYSDIFSKTGIKFNLLVSFAWFLALTNRLHIDLENQVWQRFPNYCPYCGQRPCHCAQWKEGKIKKGKVPSQQPKNLAEFQIMFKEIYPPQNRTLEHAGVHLAEELGELSEALHLFQGTHKKKYFNQLEKETADYFSCLMGVANSVDFDFAQSFYQLFPEKCHVCNQKVCICNFF
jgi:NTP pyrophosphatase (non-canonical NTP hydrolase)